MKIVMSSSCVDRYRLSLTLQISTTLSGNSFG
jgi:hypothetical protein